MIAMYENIQTNKALHVKSSKKSKDQGSSKENELVGSVATKRLSLDDQNACDRDEEENQKVETHLNGDAADSSDAEKSPKDSGNEHIDANSNENDDKEAAKTSNH